MEDKKYFCNDCNSEMNKGEASVFTVCDRCWNKHYNNPHPSDSDIEKMWPGEVWDEGKNELVRVLELNRARQEGAKWMRDRMNGEMELLIEWLDKETGAGRGMWLLNSEEDRAAISIKQLLQKFRNNG